MNTKEKSRQWVLWLSVGTMLFTIFGAFTLAFMGKGSDVNSIASLVGTTNVALSGLGIGNYATKVSE